MARLEKSCCSGRLTKVLDIAKTIATIDIKTDGVEGVSKRTPFLTEEQMAIKPLFDLRSLLDN